MNTIVKGNAVVDVVKTMTFGRFILKFIKNELELLLIENGLGSSATALKAKLLSSALNSRHAGMRISAQL